jgi:hypothetical protein
VQIPASATTNSLATVTPGIKGEATVSDKETLSRAVDLLSLWESDPYRWGVERMYHAISPLKKILEHARLGLSLNHPIKDYLYEVAVARGILSSLGKKDNLL